MSSDVRKDGAAGVDRMWDSQWVNVVNAPEVLQAETAEEAVNIAVKLTEQAMAANHAKASAKSAEQRAVLLEALRQIDATGRGSTDGGNHFRCQQIARAAIALAQGDAA